MLERGPKDELIGSAGDGADLLINSFEAMSPENQERVRQEIKADIAKLSPVSPDKEKELLQLLENAANKGEKQ